MASTTAFAGTVPQNYETYLGPLFFEPYAVDLVQRIKGGDYTNVLELACGTGRVTRHLLKKLKEDGTLHATDLNPDMLRIAREQLQDRRIAWSVTDAHQLPFDSISCDLVICQFGVMFFQDKPKAFLEVHRVLKKGGRFYFNTWDHVRSNAVSNLTLQVLQEIFPDDPPSFFDKGPYSLSDSDVIRSLLQEAGFNDITLTAVPKISTALSPDDPITGILDGSPLTSYLTERKAPVDKVRERLREEFVKHYGETNLQLPMQAFVCEAVKNN